MQYTTLTVMMNTSAWESTPIVSMDDDRDKDIGPSDGPSDRAWNTNQRCKHADEQECYNNQKNAKSQ